MTDGIRDPPNRTRFCLSQATFDRNLKPIGDSQEGRHRAFRFARRITPRPRRPAPPARCQTLRQQQRDLWNYVVAGLGGRRGQVNGRVSMYNLEVWHRVLRMEHERALGWRRLEHDRHLREANEQTARSEPSRRGMLLRAWHVTRCVLHCRWPWPRLRRGDHDCRSDAANELATELS